MTNTDLEIKNLLGSKTQQKKRLRDLVRELGNYHVILEDLANAPNQEFFKALDSANATYFEAMIMQQFAKAIVNADTRAAEFLRDTAGEKPTTSVDVFDSNKALSQMSTQELESHLAALMSLQDCLLDKNEYEDTEIKESNQ